MSTKKLLKSRCYSLILYPNENEKDLKTLQYIVDNFDYAYIEHDKDIWEKDVFNDKGELIHKVGEPKKNHTHVIICFKNARYIDKLKEELEIDYIETCNFYASSRYLIHLGYPNKSQYLEEQIITNIYTRVHNALKREYNQSEQDTRILLDYIFQKSQQSFLSFKSLTEFAIENDCLIELKKNVYFYKSFCDESGFRRY